MPSSWLGQETRGLEPSQDFKSCAFFSDRATGHAAGSGYLRGHIETSMLDGMILPTMVADEKISTRMLPPGLPLTYSRARKRTRSDGAFNLAWRGLKAMERPLV